VAPVPAPDDFRRVRLSDAVTARKAPEGRQGVRLAYLKRIYESSRGFLEVESFNTFDSHEIWLTFFDEEGWPRLRKSWGDDAFGQPDFDLGRQLLLSLRFEGFPEVETERLVAQMTIDLQEHP
jgi:hypothetical protein